MKWPDVLDAIRAAVMVDSVLQPIYGDSIRLMGTGDLKAPLLEYFLVADGETELWEPITIQFDQWTLQLEDLIASERRLRGLFHRELPEVIGGLRMWAQYQDGDSLTTPNRDNFHGRAIRFRLTPLRSRYAP